MILDQRTVLIKDKNKKVAEDIILRQVEMHELSQVISLENMVFDSLPNKQVLVTDSYEEMLEDMELGAKVIGVFNSKGELISYRYISFPGDRDKNMGKYIGINQKEFDRVVHLETTVVHPKYRGNDLQNITLGHAMKMTREAGYYHYLCTVSPFNFYSLYNIMKNGLKIKALRKMYSNQVGQDGLIRFVLHRDVRTAQHANPIEMISSKFDDVIKNAQLINEGFVGEFLSKESQKICFVK